MRHKILDTIDIISSFGLAPNLECLNKHELLEKSLIELYNLYFSVKYKFEETEYPDFDNSILPDIRKNIIANFPNFGFYEIADNIEDLKRLDDVVISDAIDDLYDIIVDLIEVKWRIENNSLDDALWHFSLNFQTHTKQHILGLLNYISLTNK